MPEQNIKTIYNGVPEVDMPKSYIDLRNIEINSEQDLANVCQVFRNPKFETFRIIYMRDNQIVGYESITSRLPNSCNIFKNNKLNPKSNIKNGLREMKNRMYRLGANGYYLMHNHPSGKAKASMEDIKVTNAFSRSADGFKGHIVVDHGTYAWIDADEDNKRIHARNEIPIDYFAGSEPSKIVEKNPFMTVRITSQNDLARLMYDVKHSNNYSVLLLTNAQAQIRLLQEIPNSFINMSYRQIGGYIKNRAIDTGSTRAFMTTTDKPFFDRAKELVSYGLLSDCIAYQVINDKAEIIEKCDSKVINQNIFRVIRKDEFERA